MKLFSNMVSLFSYLSIYALEAEGWILSELNTFIDQLCMRHVSLFNVRALET